MLSNRDIFELDNEESQPFQPTLDTSHQFLHFSRKITEAASMKRPVDIQLGITCGRDLLFTRSMAIKHPPLSSPSSLSSLSFDSMEYKSLLLDRLVSDVLQHIDSCPAYSDDLSKLKPRLEAYRIKKNCVKT
ncbi:hypothetical protein CU098_008298 [Rhizopus stolonifer]|uniref:Uncharacterized protein n=1 Tax=Rhizopus stolonifer TaxID=4846 RepID=A0A367J089_RHIST|nr:hypothetical protein CU098_008298 [Rhizopus stolonifer]